jgi:hypothetical protein
MFTLVMNALRIRRAPSAPKLQPLAFDSATGLLQEVVALKRTLGFLDAQGVQRVNMAMALVAWCTALLPTSLGSRRRRAVWISKVVMVKRLAW